MFSFMAPFNSSLLARGTALAESGSVKVQADAQSRKNARRKHFFSPPSVGLFGSVWMVETLSAEATRARFERILSCCLCRSGLCAACPCVSERFCKSN